MKFLIRLSIIFLLFSLNAYAALDDDTIWEVRTTGNNNNGGGFVWVDLTTSAFKWTAGAGGTGEFYCELAAGGDPSLTEPTTVTTGGDYALDTNGTVDSLNAGEWDWADSDTLGFNTVYVRLDDDADPDTKGSRFVMIGKAGGTDYSQQNSAQLSNTDFATSGIGVTTLTSVTGGFTTAMIGNIIQLSSGTNLTEGFYEITAHTNTNTVTLDRAPDDGVGGVSSATGGVGGAIAQPHAMQGGVVAGNITFIKAGTYVKIGANAFVLRLSVVGNSGAYIGWIGYNTIRKDFPVGTNRPLLDGNSNTALVMDLDVNNVTFNYFRNLRFENATSHGVDVGSLGGNKFKNCKMAGNGGQGILDMATNYLFGCEMNNNSGDGVNAGNADSPLWGCYVHDNTGLGLDGGNRQRWRFFWGIIDTNTGAGGIKGKSIELSNSIIYNNSGDAISTIGGGTSGRETLGYVINTIISDNSGFAYDSDTITPDAHWFIMDFNNYFNNGSGPLNNIEFGSNDIVTDPNFTNAAAGDFTLQSGSPCLDAGWAMDTTTTATGDYKMNIGVDQDDNTVGNGAATTSYGFMQ